MEGRLIKTISDSVREAIALEEALLLLHPPDVVTLHAWTCTRPSVVIGRNQSLKSEVDVEKCTSCGIEIARRTTGGGAVFLDQKTWVASFMAPVAGLPCTGAVEDLVAFFTSLVIAALEDQGVPGLEPGPRGIVTREGMKVSGSAQQHHKGTVLHHATVLAGADLEMMEGVLLAGRREYHPGAKTRSHPHPVTNLELSISLDDWVGSLVARLGEVMSVHFKEYVPTNEQEARARALLASKHASPGWVMEGIS